MKIVIANLASPANPGDQAIFRGTLKMLRALYQTPEISVVTRAYSERKSYEDLGCRVIANYPDVEFIASDSLFKKLINIPRALMKPGMLKGAIREADLVLLIGGAYFYSYRPLLPGLTYLSHFSALTWARHYIIPIIFLPQSYGPFVSQISQKIFDGAVRGSDFIFYRENITGEWLRRRYPDIQGKFAFMPDLALNLKRDDLIPPFSKNFEMGCVGATIRAWKTGNQDQHSYMDVLVDTLTWLHQEYHLKVRIIVQVQDPKKGEGDEWISSLLAERMQEKIGREFVELCTARPYFQLSEICGLYQQCDFLIGMRLHSTLLSFLVGRPALAVGYQHKAEGILKALGLDGLYLGSFETAQMGHLQEACSGLIRNYSMWTQKIENALQNARGEIKRFFEEKITQIAR